jgi:DNA polymerase I-like protein with 3'-5' exonuclease and polymerase domains
MGSPPFLRRSSPRRISCRRRDLEQLRQHFAEAPEEETAILRSLVRERMEQVHPLKVPLLVEIGVGKNWRDMEYA